MDYIADRIKGLNASGIRKIWQLAMKMTDPVNFTIGQPDFDAPEPVKQAAIQAIQDGKNGYTLTTGIQELRDVIDQQITDEFGWQNPLSIVTSGVSGGLQLLLMSTINPGDEVLIPDPYFVIYRHIIEMLGGKCVFIDTYPDFQLKAEQVAEKITDKTKLLIMNSPANPSGTVYTPETLKAVADVAKKHDLLVLSDEIYCDFSYDIPAESIAKYYENTVIMRGFSKAYGVPGWRMGYLVLQSKFEELFDRMGALQQYTFVCAPHPFQIAAIEAMKCDITEHINNYRNKRDMIYEGLKDFGLVKPAGSFYAFVPAPGGNATEFITAAIDQNVLTIPGSVFSQKDTHFRISYATSDQQIEKGIERLRKAAEKFM